MDPSFDSAALLALVAVVVIDIVLSGDNAVVLGLIVSGLPEERRRRVISLGVALATLMRVGLAFVAIPILNIIGLTLAGGVLLLWVAWKIWREARQAAVTSAGATGSCAVARTDVTHKTPRQAIVQIALADFAMSLDNVLGVAGAAREYPWVLVIGLALSIAMMAFAAGLVARLLDRYPWLVYLGLAVVMVVSLRMIWQGSADVLRTIRLAQPLYTAAAFAGSHERLLQQHIGGYDLTLFNEICVDPTDVSGSQTTPRRQLVR